MIDHDQTLTHLQKHLPLDLSPYKCGSRPTGLVIIDEVNGFCTVGAGNLAPQRDDVQITNMVNNTDALARECLDRRFPVLSFLDTHEPGVPEPPYPPHCVRGTGEENLVPELTWLADHPDVTIIRKDCINGLVGSIEIAPKGHGLSHNRCIDWINLHGLEDLLVVGICTDICVMDFVLTILSVRNHGMSPSLKNIVVVEEACATYDLPLSEVERLGLPLGQSHPKMETHHLGLYFMASRGAEIAGSIEFVERN